MFCVHKQVALRSAGPLNPAQFCRPASSHENLLLCRLRRCCSDRTSANRPSASSGWAELVRKDCRWLPGRGRTRLTRDDHPCLICLHAHLFGCAEHDRTVVLMVCCRSPREPAQPTTRHVVCVQGHLVLRAALRAGLIPRFQNASRTPFLTTRIARALRASAAGNTAALRASREQDMKWPGGPPSASTARWQASAAPPGPALQKEPSTSGHFCKPSAFFKRSPELSSSDSLPLSHLSCPTNSLVPSSTHSNSLSNNKSPHTPA